MPDKTFSLDLTTTAADVGGTPDAGKVWTVAMVQIANVDGANPVDVTVQWIDASASNKVTRLVRLATIEARQSLSPVIGSLTLEAGDKLQAFASAAGDAELTMTVIEEGA